MIELTNVSKVYNPDRTNQYQALCNVTLNIDDGEFCAIIGKSGSGKSTLLHIIGLVDTLSSGDYKLNGVSMQKLSEVRASKTRASNIGFVKQDFALIEDYTALDNVMLPLYPVKAREKKKKALAALEKLHISELADKETKNLSGGEKQRVAIARAIVNDPKLILADEPTGSLDSKTADEIMRVFTELNSDGKTVIIITHDKSIAERCDRIIEIADGKTQA